MFLVGIINWWYGAGWRRRFTELSGQLGATARYFSVSQLLATLFSPYKQISAGRVQGALAVQLQAFFDKLFSRLVGAAVRFGTIVIAGIVLLFEVIYGLVMAVVWPLVPLFPVAGLIMAVVGWVPIWL